MNGETCMFFEGSDQIRYLRKKYSKEKLIIFTGGKKKAVSQWRRVLHKVLQVLSKELNYDLYIFDPVNDKALSKYGAVFRYDETCIKPAMFKIEDIVEAGCRRAFVLNTDIIDKRLYNENISYRFLFLSTIKEIYLPESQPNHKINIGGADIFNVVRDVEGLNTEKVCYCNKECLKEFKENLFKHPDKLVYFKMEKKDKNKHIKIIDNLLE